MKFLRKLFRSKEPAKQADSEPVQRARNRGLPEMVPFQKASCKKCRVQFTTADKPLRCWSGHCGWICDSCAGDADCPECGGALEVVWWCN